MDFLTPEHFFDLSLFEHAALFDLEQPVWVALQRLSLYLQKCALGEIEGSIEPGAFLDKPELISIGKGSHVEAGAYIRGPCIIGEDCEIRHGAYIRGDVIAGNGCVIGHATEVKHSILLDKAQAGHFAYLGDSILGNKVNLGAGTKCANLRLDHKNVPILFGEKRLDSGLRKLGAIIGDHAQLGCNSVTNPGALMGKGCCAYPGVVISGYVAEGHIVKPHDIPVVASFA